MGDVQEGGEHFFLAFDFPNYVDKEDSQIPTNYYVALYFKQMNAFFFLDGDGNVYPLDRLKSCMARETDAVYAESLQFDYCNPGTSLDVTMYILAVESGYDPHENLLLEPAHTPFELWYYDFSFGRCP